MLSFILSLDNKNFNLVDPFTEIEIKVQTKEDEKNKKHNLLIR